MTDEVRAISKNGSFVIDIKQLIKTSYRIISPSTKPFRADG